ncbi:hypothetical protein CYMTET_6647 [Cymbomonas tetramitiformis]|uniref:Alpha-soluble NSF attachment protein n=1 Tax=Cymbomonas tetramitiformis TaxID=36881 RepID=A0AAE0GX13_9CHLO|nr:hypothetical protein CYMTET_6647 [Cymbomonas tetramitiformis]|eukprot:gene16761-19911_t
MSDAAAKAEAQVAKAAKTLKGWSFFGMGSKYEDAAELYEKAANNFKLAKMWDEAALTFLKLADVHFKLESKHEAASAFVDAANAYKKTDQLRAVDCLEKAIDQYTDMGRLSMAAKHHKDVGEILENEGDFQKSMFHFEQAADLYAGEEQSSTSNTCKLKVAQFSAQLELWQKAVEIYEAVALQSLDNNLLKFSVKNYLLNAGLCKVLTEGPTGELIGTSNALQRYKEMDPSFGDTRECKFISDIVAAVEEGDTNAFRDVVTEFDSMSRLDQWKTKVLLKIKALCEAREGVADGDEDLT